MGNIQRRIEVYKNLSGRWKWRLRNDATHEVLALSHKDYVNCRNATVAAKKEEELYQPGTCALVILED